MDKPKKNQIKQQLVTRGKKINENGIALFSFYPPDTSHKKFGLRNHINLCSMAHAKTQIKSPVNDET